MKMAVPNGTASAYKVPGNEIHEHHRGANATELVHDDGHDGVVDETADGHAHLRPEPAMNQQQIDGRPKRNTRSRTARNVAELGNRNSAVPDEQPREHRAEDAPRKRWAARKSPIPPSLTFFGDLAHRKRGGRMFQRRDARRQTIEGRHQGPSRAHRRERAIAERSIAASHSGLRCCP